MSKRVRVSLQVCAPNNCEAYLSERISHFERALHSSHENRAHVENLKGLRAVLQTLMANIEIVEKTVRLSYLNFDEALAFFLSYRSNAQKSMLTDRYQKKRFMNLLYHAKNGLPVYLVQNQYVVLRSADVDLDLFLEISQKSMSEKEHFSVTQVNSILDSLDTSWDRKVCKVILGEHLSKEEHKETGLGLRVCKHKSQVFEAIETRKAVRNEAETNVKKEISEKLSRIDQRNLHEEENLEKKSKLLNKQQHDELTEKIEDLKDRN